MKQGDMISVYGYDTMISSIDTKSKVVCFETPVFDYSLREISSMPLKDLWRQILKERKADKALYKYNAKTKHNILKLSGMLDRMVVDVVELKKHGHVCDIDMIDIPVRDFDHLFLQLSYIIDMLSFEPSSTNPLYIEYNKSLTKKIRKALGYTK